MNIATTRFGTIEASAQDLIVLPQGLIGFAALTRFAVIQFDQDGVFRWWQAVDAPDTAFVVLDPLLITPDYDLRGIEAEWSELGADDPGARDVAVIVTVSGPRLESVTLNLSAPIAVNRATRQGRQVVLPDGRYDVAVRLDDMLAPKGPVELAA
jgi:flagellar assembly factor FliW